jgi:SAM-dependent methyltransferase
VTPRRAQKAEILVETVQRLFPERTTLEMVDFGCADGAVPVMLLRSSLGPSIARIVGITLLDYNDLAEKRTHLHPRFCRVVADLEKDMRQVELPWGKCDVVLATGFFHYLAHPELALAHAKRLLRPGGYLLAGMPARWVLALRRHGVPGVLPQNERIRQVESLDCWKSRVESAGFHEADRQAVQWFGWGITARLERWVRHHRLLAGSGSNYLVVYRADTRAGAVDLRERPSASCTRPGVRNPA